MRQELVTLVALLACAPKEPAGPEPDRGEPTEPACDESLGTVDATSLDTEPYPLNPLGRRLAVGLDGPAGAVVTCTLEEAPPLWREVVPLDTVWRYTTADPGPSFADPGHDDASWDAGPAPFGHEDPAATELAPDDLYPPDRAWFRTTFEVDDPAAVRTVAAAIRRDDGVVVWLNGAEVHRDNVPAVERMGGDDERRLFAAELDPSALVAGTNVLAVELHQAPDSTDGGFAARLALEVDELLPETHVLRSEASSASHTFDLYGLLGDATYVCEARSTACDGATASTTIATDPLDVPLVLANPPGRDVPGWGSYTLLNHQRPCDGDRKNRLFVVDPEGRVRWHRELPIEASSTIDIESALQPDGTILWAGGQQPEGRPSRLALDGEEVWVASYPEAGEHVYHHDVEALPSGRILGIVEDSTSDGTTSWAGWGLVEHDPATDEVTWQWDAQQAFDAGELVGPLYGDPDPWHANSLAYVEDADGPAVYVSLYYSNEIVRVDRTTGELTWHLGPGGDFALTGGSWFDGMHAIDVFDGRLFLYDNGFGGQSRAMSITLDAARAEATVDWEWTEPLWFEPNWGDADLLPGGTVLVAMAHAYCLGGNLDHPGALVEVDEASGEVVWRLDFLDSDDSTYRAQRIDGCALFANRRYCR